MYEAYWKLTRRPFESTSEADLYYPSETHQGALLKLRYSIENRKGAALLAGDHGVGKTMVVDLLRRHAPSSCGPLLHLVFPQMPAADLLAYLAEELTGTSPSSELPSVQQSVRTIQRELAANTAEGRHAVAVIDEAHLLEDASVWDSLRLLLNFQSAGGPDLTLILCGQLPLLTTIDRMPSWEERINVKCLLRSLSLEETACYVQHRLKQAGGQPEIFTQGAIEALYKLSGGFPRRINRLADLALVIGYAEERSIVSATEIEAVCGELITVAQNS